MGSVFSSSSWTTMSYSIWISALLFSCLLDQYTALPHHGPPHIHHHGENQIITRRDDSSLVEYGADSTEDVGNIQMYQLNDDKMLFKSQEVHSDGGYSFYNHLYNSGASIGHHEENVIDHHHKSGSDIDHQFESGS